ncbi:MAG TPA: DNA/RNA nuclease SfsA [Bacillota bacterium]|nr:DNA/RNA nuclease SfsA [Bacillota bacterium]HPZ90252.1 DNA/RNA nuclease SfsA [Bacillota bacterium]HQE01642.1 DNA/RNA nuclease SfsA [Bacillota bacterium]
MPMHTLYVPGEFLPGRFCRRPNRFVAVVDIGGETVTAHVPTSGRLGELLLPGAEVQVRRAAGPKRKTAWDLMLVRTGDTWVSLDSRLPNFLVGQLLRADALPPFRGATDIRPESTFRGSRFDFAFSDGDGRPTLVEVKSVTLVEGGLAMFPDAPTTRGARHVEELALAAAEGYRAAVLFIVQRDDAVAFAPNRRTDPAFARALCAARAAGVEVYAWKCRAEANALACLLSETGLPIRCPAPAPTDGGSLRNVD